MNGGTTAMTDRRRADTARRRGRVTQAITDTVTAGEDVTVSGVARRARVDRTFLYRHPDLLSQVHAAAAQPPPTVPGSPTVSRASLHGDLLAAQQRCTRLAARTQQLERRLSQTLGEQAWRETGLGAAPDIDQLQQRVVHLEQQIVDLRLQLAEREEDLRAARAANRELITRLNTAAQSE